MSVYGRRAVVCMRVVGTIRNTLKEAGIEKRGEETKILKGGKSL